ncbi:MAG: oligopeptide/dipeptide transporter, ATPase subunit [Acidimicrobiaceae bacterium]|nr:oligopeptide/dipeptide transporter, ATPase subunit [Acidimicrobiaceae bacterium]
MSGAETSVRPASTALPEPAPDPVVEVADLEVDFAVRGAIGHAVRGVSFQIRSGEAVGLVGESGSGKTVTALSLLRLLPDRTTRVRARSLRVAGVDVLGASAASLARLRGGAAGVVFQDPLRALTPTRRVGSQIVEVIERHSGRSRTQARLEAVELLSRVGIPDARNRARDYPHQFSGGQRQRILLATAVASHPRLLIADEPTTALDVTTQSQILDLLLDLQQDLKMAVLLISHDLGVIARVCDRVLVMYGGRLVETGSTSDVFRAPGHPYTAGLLRSIPRLDRPGAVTSAIPGEAVDGFTQVVGCAFVPRCSLAAPVCTECPELEDVTPGHQAACWRSELVT